MSKEPNESVGKEVNQLFDQAIRDLNVDKKARDSGVNNQPSANSAGLDTNEREFKAYFENILRKRRQQCEHTLSKNEQDRTSTSAKIDIGQTRHSLSRLFNSIDPDLARLKQDHQQNLERTKEEEATALRELRHFQQSNNLDNRAAENPAPSKIWHFAVVSAFAVLEWISLSIFYAEGSDFGILGGVVMAMALSLINIVLAVVIGHVLCYLNHINVTRKLLGVVSAAIMIVLFVFATGFAAHYRNAVREIAAPHANTQMQSLSAPSKHVPLAANPLSSGDDDQWRASKLGYQYFLKEGFVFSDTLSWLLVILAGMFGLIAAWKGYRIDDRYPGYGAIYRKSKQCEEDYRIAKNQYTEAIDNIFDSTGQKQQGLLRDVKKQIEYFQDLTNKSEAEARRYVSFAQEAVQACNNVIFRYRERNRLVATAPKPAYFNDPVNLDPLLLSAPSALSDDERRKLSEYTNAMLEFSNVVQEDDRKRQEMRKLNLDRLDAFFKEIEAAIRDKHAREARLYGG